MRPYGGGSMQGVSRVAIHHTTSRKPAQRDRRVKILVAEPAASQGPTATEWHRRGLEAVVAHDAVEALERFRDDAPNAVVIDDRLPGFELSGLVRIFHASRGNSSVPVILLSHSDQGAAMAESIGADAVIHSPRTAGRLPEAVESAVALTKGSRR